MEETVFPIPIGIWLTIAKVIVFFLRFLNRGKLTIAKYIKHGTKNKKEYETIEVNQFFSFVWGKIRPSQNSTDNPWAFYGFIRDRVLVGTYYARKKTHHWQGSFTLMLIDNAGKLRGYYSGFEENGQEIVTAQYEWTKTK